MQTQIPDRTPAANFGGTSRLRTLLLLTVAAQKDGEAHELITGNATDNYKLDDLEDGNRSAKLVRLDTGTIATFAHSETPMDEMAVQVLAQQVNDAAPNDAFYHYVESGEVIAFWQPDSGQTVNLLDGITDVVDFQAIQADNGDVKVARRMLDGSVVEGEFNAEKGEVRWAESPTYEEGVTALLTLPRADESDPYLLAGKADGLEINGNPIAAFAGKSVLQIAAVGNAKDKAYVLTPEGVYRISDFNKKAPTVERIGENTGFQSLLAGPKAGVIGISIADRVLQPTQIAAEA